jgi:hypothetical protein
MLNWEGFEGNDNMWFKSTAGIFTGWTARVRLPQGVRDFFLPHSSHTDSEAHPVSYRMGTGELFLEGKAAGE